jgi:hypothetical protein
VSVHADSSALWDRARNNTTTTSRANITTVSVPGDPVAFERTMASMTPISTPPSIASGNDTIAPMSAATRPRRRRSGPRATEMSFVRWFRIGAAITALIAARVPATTHTWVDTAFTRTPESDAPLGLSAAARSARPKRVRRRSTASRTTMTGTAMSTITCSLRMVRLPMCQIWSNAVGNARFCSTSGSWSWSRRMTCDTPIVATNRSSRGCLNSRRTTSSSVRPPSRAPVRIAIGSVTQKSQP